MTRILALIGLVATVSAAPTTATRAPTRSPAASLEGVFTYTGSLKGQAIIMNGHFIFLFGSASGGGMMSHAGSYRIRGDTARATIQFSTDSTAVGKSLRWTVTSWSADTATYVMMDPDGQENGTGRAVRMP